MKSIKQLEDELAEKQELYDKTENNPYLQSKLQKDITKIVYQLQLWDDLYASVGDTRPTYKNK